MAKITQHTASRRQIFISHWNFGCCALGVGVYFVFYWMQTTVVVIKGTLHANFACRGRRKPALARSARDEINSNTTADCFFPNVNHKG